MSWAIRHRDARLSHKHHHTGKRRNLQLSSTVGNSIWDEEPEVLPGPLPPVVEPEPTPVIPMDRPEVASSGTGLEMVTGWNVDF